QVIATSRSPNWIPRIGIRHRKGISMSSNHTVVQGEHLTRIVEQYHFFDHTIVWDHAKNAALKAKRTNLNVLYPGDTVFIPDKTPKTETRPTTATHVFKVKAPPLEVRLKFLDYDGNPANAELKFQIDTDKGKIAIPTGLFSKPILRAW